MFRRFLTLSIFLTCLFVGCSSNSPIPEAEVARLRVKLQQLNLEISSTDSEIEMQKYIYIAENAEELGAYQLAATAYSLCAKYFEKIGDTSLAEKQASHYQTACDYYIKALYFDKTEQNAYRKQTDPYPNADEIAISLSNLSFIYEKLKDKENALKYAGRAFKINYKLNLYKRVIQDCKRLSRIHREIGNDTSADEFDAILKETEIKLEDIESN